MPNPRKPTALKVLEGTDRPDRANPDEPQYTELTAAEPPDTLRDGRAVQIWHDLVGVLGSQRVITVADRLALTELCNQQSEVDQVRRAGGMPGPGDKTQLRLMFAEFGLTPASRSKVSGVGPSKADNEFAELIG